MNRVCADLEIRSADEGEERILVGIASTVGVDRMGDVVVPEGAKFALPLPLLHQHNSHEPIGEVIEATVTGKRITVKARIAKNTGLQYIEDAWKQIKSRLVKGFSIGFRAIKHELLDPKDPWGGRKFLEWEWIELSTVTIQANEPSVIQTVKALDRERPRLATVLASPKTSAGGTATTLRPGGQTKVNIQEQIRSLEATHTALLGQQTALMDKARGEGRTLDSEEGDTFDSLTKDVESVVADLARLRKMETAVIPKAIPVAGGNPGEAQQVRAGVAITGGRSQVPKGIPFVRYAMALANSGGSISDALMFARRWKDSTPEVLLALEQKVGTAGSTTDSDWAAPLVYPTQLASEFLELLRPATVIGRLPLKNVPFNVRIARQTGGSTVAWVGESAPKPLSDLAFDYVTLAYTKVAGIVVITEELARLSSPSAEGIVRDDMVRQIAQFLDEQFLDPAITATAGVRPASVTNGVTAIPASGTDAAALRCDLRDLFATFTAANLSPSGSTLVMSEIMAASIGMMVNALGQPEFTGLGAGGGTLAGLPVVTSQSSVLDDQIVMIKGSEILLAQGGIEVDVSREATLDLAGGTAPAFSLWQRNCVGIRAEQWANWAKARAAAVGVISGADYGACAEA